MQPDDKPSGYEDEPREYFHPLPPDLYTTLYHWERLSQYPDDEGAYYRSRLGPLRFVLELGCGTGVISSYLQSCGITVIGIDISRPMLVHPLTSTRGPVVQMDMRSLGFKTEFEAALIAHNSLNLLITEQAIHRCLTEIKRVLLPGGLLLLHLYTTESEAKNNTERTLQFSIFNHPHGGKIIKETIRSQLPESDFLVLEERYKIRRFSSEHRDMNYRHSLQMAAFSKEKWLQMVADSGYVITSLQHDFPEIAASPANQHRLLVTALNG